MIDPTKGQALLDWYRSEYDRRTNAIEDGSGKIDWLIPGYRVSFTEVIMKAEQLGIRMNPVDLRRWFDEAQNKKVAS